MLKPDDIHRFRFRGNIELDDGPNLIEAIGRRDGETFIDSAVWNVVDDE